MFFKHIANSKPTLKLILTKHLAAFSQSKPEPKQPADFNQSFKTKANLNLNLTLRGLKVILSNPSDFMISCYS